MPLSRDKQGGGSEVDGNKSQLYCSFCYQQGAFIEPHITCEQMVEKVNGVLKGMYIPAFLAKYFTKDIPKLKRWQKEL